MENKHIWPGWETMEMLGAGGFSKVYKIKKDDGSGDFFSALKVVTIPQNKDEYRVYRLDGYDDESMSKIFKGQVDDLLKEIRLMSRFRGTAHIVSYEDHMIVPEQDGIGWKILIRMELLTTLPARYMSAPLDENEIVKLGMDICEALILCEKFKIIHRDIKPQNIFINEFGDYKLGDFGVARSMDHTTHATRIGTCTYMAPEVYRGEAYNNTADIYSLGLTLYWLLNERRLPFVPMPPAIPSAADNNIAVNRRFAGEQLPEPKNGSKKLKQLILKACSFNPADRFKTAKEMSAALSSVLADPIDENEGSERTVTIKNAESVNNPKTKIADKKVMVNQENYFEVNNSDDKTLLIKDENRSDKADKVTDVKRKKHLWIIICCLIAVIVIGVVVGAFAMSEEEVTWSLEYGTLTISGDGAMTNSGEWRDERSNIEFVIIEDGITTIEAKAFEGCSNLEGVSIPDSVKSIGDSAFNKCSLLESVTIPDGVTSIGKWAFANCSNLYEVCYSGTKSSWGEVSKPLGWSIDSPFTVVYCIDLDANVYGQLF